MAFGIQRIAAELARRAAARAHERAVTGEREHLLRRRPQPKSLAGSLQLLELAEDVACLLDLVRLALVADQLLDLEQQQVAFVLVSDGEPPRPPHRFDRFLERHLLLVRAEAGLL